MKIIKNNFSKPLQPRHIVCPHCTSELSITDEDVKPVQGVYSLLCPCCGQHFPTPLAAQLVAATA